MTTSAKPIVNSPYGYGATNLDQLKLYLNRHVNHICFSSEEDLYAATVIAELQQHIQRLEQELHHLKQQKVEVKSTVEHQSLEVIEEQMAYERTLDSERLYYCMTHEVFMVENQIFANLESEMVVNDDFRSALDRLVGHLYISR